MLVLLIIQQISGFSINSIPSTASPPNAKIGSAAVYDPQSESIFTIGGQESAHDLVTSEVNIFDLKANKWKTPEIISEFEPSFLVNHNIHLRSDRNIIVFGRFSEVFLFNIDQFAWSKSNLSGDQIYGVRGFASTSVVLNGTEYFVIFGGINPLGYVNGLYLIDVNNLVSEKLPNNGNPPSPRMISSIVYYNNSFYVYGYANYDYAAGLETGSELYRYDISEKYWEIVKTNGIPPGPRNNHYACIYNEEMFIVYGIMPEYTYEYHSIVKFNFQTSTWTYVYNNPKSGIFLASSVQISNKLYLIYGRTLSLYSNSIFYIDLQHPEVDPKILTENWISPSKRVFHCSFVVNLKMYIFGGSDGINSDAEQYYGDMWAFDFESQVWGTVNSLGDPPSARKNFAFCKVSGDIIAIFGGKGYDGYLSDLYYFHEPSQKWHIINPANGLPSKRSNACMVFYNNILYIIGGKNDEEGFSEVWMYNFITNLITLSSIKIGGTSDFVIKNIIDATCWVETSEEYFTIQIAGGVDSIGYPNTKLIRIYFFNNNTQKVNASPLGNLLNQALIGSETAVIRFNNFAIRFGGSIFSWMIFQNIVIYDLIAGSYKLFDTKGIFNFFGHTAVHYKKSIYVFGGGASSEIYKSYSKYSNNLLKIDFDQDTDGFELGCSPGTFGGACEPCPAGTYSSSNICVECPAGRYLNSLGSISIEQCRPCKSGSYSNSKGSSRCRNCETGYTCPIGSIYPKRTADLFPNSSIQPVPYNSHKSEIKNITSTLWYTMVSIFIIICCICLIFRVIWNNIKKIDIFVGNHNNSLDVPVINRKTQFGGLFSIFFIMISLVTFVSALLSFYFDNIYEIQALIPAISLDSSIEASFLQINSTFYSYGGTCESGESCIPEIHYSDIGIKYSSRRMNCYLINENCHVVTNYISFAIINKQAEVFFSLEEISSYATGVSVNITTASSIPDQISNVFLRITTESPDQLLKGSIPSNFYFKFTPSDFTSESSNWPEKETGYHIWNNFDPEVGSQVDQETMNLKMHLKLRIGISESDTAMQTQRRLNQTWLVFFGTLLGSIFGLMGTVAALMNFTEVFSEKVKKKFVAKKKLGELLEKRNSLFHEFENNDFVKGNRKVTPMVYEVNETGMEKCNGS